MEAKDQDSSPSTSAPQTESPVLNISGNMELTRRTPYIPPPPKISPTTFPVITGRILLKKDVPPPAPKINPLDFAQYLCFLCMEKPATKKRMYHMYLSNEKDLEKDSAGIRKIYENRKDLKIVDRLVMETLCSRALYHRAQNKLTNVTWNKQKNIFETDWIGERDYWNFDIDALQQEEWEKFFNYIKFLSATNS